LPLLTPILSDSPEILVLQWEWFCKIVYPMSCHCYTALLLGVEKAINTQKSLSKTIIEVFDGNDFQHHFHFRFTLQSNSL